MDFYKNARPDPKTAPPLEQWRTLYQLADELKQLAPWKSVYDSQLFRIELPEDPEPYFCSIMGNGGESFGIAVYPGYEAFARLLRLLDTDSNELEMLLAVDQRVLVCEFCNSEEVSNADRAVIKSLGLRFRGKHQWTTFRSGKPGQFPWFLTAEEAGVLCRVMPQALAALRQYLTAEDAPEFRDGVILRWRPAESGWVLEEFPLEGIQIPVERIKVDESEWLPYKRKRKTRDVLELEAGYLPVPVQESVSVPAHATYIVVLTNRKTETPVGPMPTDTWDAPPDIKIASALLDYIKKNGRPAALYVRSEWIAEPVRDICSGLGIRLHIGEDLSLSESMIHFLYLMLTGDDEVLGALDELSDILDFLDDDDDDDAPDNLITFPKRLR